MLGSLFFLASLAILYYVIRYRVHVHFSIEVTTKSNPVRSLAHQRRGERHASPGIMTPRAAKTATNRGGFSADSPTAVPIDSVVWGDISSALMNLGAKRHRAEAAAQHVVRNWPDAGFDAQFREALKEVQAA